MTSPVVNIAELELDSWERGTLYGGSDVRIGPMIGVKDLGITYSEVPPGKSGCPFHNHHVEDEMFIILEGEGIYRFGDKTFPIKAGSVLGAPAGGQDTAHQIIGHTEIGLAMAHISKDVDEGAHADIFKWNALGSRPRVTSCGSQRPARSELASGRCYIQPSASCLRASVALRTISPSSTVSAA